MQHLVDRDVAESFISGIEPVPTSHLDQPPIAEESLTALQAWQLYVSHFLSMWMSRTYEYSAILFIQAAFPGNLLANSIYGITETICVLIFSPSLGKWVDGATSRLRPLLTTIIANRVSLVLSSLLWTALLTSDNATFKRLMFAIVLALSMVEKVARMINIISMERDWVPTLANVDDTSGGTSYNLTQLNTSMRRIDILCKFLAPLAISTYAASVGPSRSALTIAAIATASAGAECFAVMQVWRQNGRLRKGRIVHQIEVAIEHDELSHLNSPKSRHEYAHTGRIGLWTRTFLNWLVWSYQIYKSGIKYYVGDNMLVPSLCIAILHGSVLAWSGTLVTWLLNAGFPLIQVTVAKAFGSIFEIGSTIVFPLAMAYLARKTASKQNLAATTYVQLQDASDDENEDEPLDARISHDAAKAPETTRPIEQSGNARLMKHTTDIARLSILGLSISLIPTVVSLFILATRLPTTAKGPPASQTFGEPAAVAFITFLSVSFLGRWTFDLSVTQMEQISIAPSHRSSFAGTEQAVVSCVSIVHWVAAAIFHSQKSFKWLALGSFVAVLGATAIFVFFMGVLLDDVLDPEENTVNHGEESSSSQQPRRTSLIPFFPLKA